MLNVIKCHATELNFFFLATPTKCENLRGRDQTHTTGVPWAAALTLLDLNPTAPQENSMNRNF